MVDNGTGWTPSQKNWHWKRQTANVSWWFFGSSANQNPSKKSHPTSLLRLCFLALDAETQLPLDLWSFWSIRWSGWSFHSHFSPLLWQWPSPQKSETKLKDSASPLLRSLGNLIIAYWGHWAGNHRLIGVVATDYTCYSWGGLRDFLNLNMAHLNKSRLHKILHLLVVASTKSSETVRNQETTSGMFEALLRLAAFPSLGLAAAVVFPAPAFTCCNHCHSQNSSNMVSSSSYWYETNKIMLHSKPFAQRC